MNSTPPPPRTTMNGKPVLTLPWWRLHQNRGAVLLGAAAKQFAA